MRPVRDEFVPDPTLSREAMTALQREIAAAARFEDDRPLPEPADRITIGIDQAFTDDRAVSAVVAVHDKDPIERVHAVSALEIPYIPGLLAFREGGPILDALGNLSVAPDLALFDGSGRIHFRQAGLATHLGVLLDHPSVGVAKRLLCGRPRDAIDDLPEGTRVAIEADEQVEAPTGAVLGYAVQTRQYHSATRHINPVYVSPGHLVSPGAAADHVLESCSGYKLPEPIRLADRYAAEVASSID